MLKSEFELVLELEIRINIRIYTSITVKLPYLVVWEPLWHSGFRDHTARRKIKILGSFL